MAKRNVSAIPGTPSHSKNIMRAASAAMRKANCNMKAVHCECAALVDSMVDANTISITTYKMAKDILDDGFSDLVSFERRIYDLCEKNNAILNDYKNKVITKEELVVSAAFSYDDAMNHIKEYAELSQVGLSAFYLLIDNEK